MDDYDFYKNKFDRELGRRNDLDSGINNPIAGITINVGLISYVLSNNHFKNWDYIDCTISLIITTTILTTLFSLFYIFMSNNNFLKGFDYLNFGLLREYRDFQKELIIYNEKADDIDKKDFKTEIVEKIINYSDNHTIINDRRALDLYRARKFVIITFILTILNLIILTVNNLKI